jgi:hypothetical protein
MDLAHALDEHEQQLGTRSSRQAGTGSSPLDLLRDYLLEYAGMTETEQIQQADLADLCARWYLSHEAADPQGALELVAAVERWLVWLDRRDPGARAEEFRPVAQRLREDLPRAIRALRLLQAHVHREDYPDVAAQSSSGEPLMLLSSGLSRVIRPGEVAYERAEEDDFRIEAIHGGHVSLQSPLGAHLGRPPLSPVLLPPEVALLLRVGDTLHAEVAPATHPSGAGEEPGEAWEVLEASALFPGGYHGATF